jgi:hypothetical protein
MIKLKLQILFIRHQVTKYLKAKFSKKLSLDEWIGRLKICRTCPYMHHIGPRMYCLKCNCPKTQFWPDAELNRKTRFSKSECPENKWLKEN